jgi:hypothetical protein
MPRHAGAAEKYDVACVARYQQIIWDRRTIGEKSHTLTYVASPDFAFGE